MKKVTILFLALLVSWGILAQENFTITLQGKITNATTTDTLLLLQNKDNKNYKIARIALSDKGHFNQEVKLTEKDYYILQFNSHQRINVIVTRPGTITLEANGKNIFGTVHFLDSKPNASLVEYLRVQAVYKHKLDSANEYLKSHRSNQNEIKQAFQPVYKKFLSDRSNFVKENVNSPALIGVLKSINVQKEFDLYTTVVKSLEKSFEVSPTVQRIVAQYKINKKKLASLLPIKVGSKAKDIALPSPNGDTLRLSDLRGKVVLLDFWASWCGPCRRENPNVVRAYKRFHDQGFTVFSVSLDSKKASWEKAIQQDGLVWSTHVSDLKGWHSSAADLYHVHSIPHSFLINKKGIIIANNLRGEALQRKLESIFGE